MSTIKLQFSKLSQLRRGDRILSCGQVNYAVARVVARELAQLEPGSPVRGVRLEPPYPGTRIEWVLYPSQCDGLSIVVERDVVP